MKKRFYLFCLVLIVAFTAQLTPAIKPTTQGTHTLAIKGTDFNKKPYSGTLEVRPRKINSPSDDIQGVTLKWNVGGTIYEGIGISTAKVLTATWGSSGCSLMVYAADGNQLTGLSTVVGQSKLGSETATRTSGKGIIGSYKVTGIDGENGSYKGILDIIEHGPVYQFSWDIGTKYEGIGIRTGDLVSVAWGATSKDKCGVVQYEITDSGLKDGKWGIYGEDSTGTEEGVLK